MNSEDASVAEAALGLLDMGLTPVPAGHDKRPLLRWRALQRRRPAPQTVREWFGRWPEAGLGVLTGTGRPGLDCVDVDPGASHEWMAGDLGAPLVHRTPRGGRHLLFRHTEGVRNSNSKLSAHVDVRGTGGYVIVPPSAAYEWVEGSYAEALETPPPEWLQDEMLAAPKKVRETPDPYRTPHRGATIPLAVLHHPRFLSLSPEAQMTYLRFLERRPHFLRGQIVFPVDEAARLGISRRTFQSARRELAEAGLLSFTSPGGYSNNRGRPARYSVVDLRNDRNGKPDPTARTCSVSGKVQQGGYVLSSTFRAWSTEV